MISYSSYKTKKPSWFRRRVGITLENFAILLEKIELYLSEQKTANPLKRRGNKSKLSVADRLLLTLIYLRDYPTFLNLGESFGISESYANKLYHQNLNILLKVLKMSSRKELLNSDLDTVVIDVSEQPIEKPKKRQRAYYSGKKKCHTLKVQLIICLLTLRIFSVRCEKGRVHDFKIFKNSRLFLNPILRKLCDSGYQGIQKIYQNAVIPFKKTKKKPLNKQQKQFNRQLAMERVRVENVIRRCKIFRICKETYRGKHKNHAKTWNVVAALVNLRYAA